MKITINEGWQLKHDGKLYKAGDSVEVDDASGEGLVESGMAVKARSGSKNKAVQSSQNKSLDQYATGGGWYEINGEKVQGKKAARKALESLDG